MTDAETVPGQPQNLFVSQMRSCNFCHQGILLNHRWNAPSSHILKPPIRDLEDTIAIMPAAQTLSNDFTNSYGTCTIIEKILVVIRERANAAEWDRQIEMDSKTGKQVTGASERE